MVIGMVASVLLHVLASVLLRTAGSGGPALPEPDSMVLVDFDIHEAPAPPEAELAAEDMPVSEEEPGAPAEPAPVEETSPTPEDDDAADADEAAAEVVPEGIALADAGPADAAAVADAEPADAGPADAAAVAEAEPADAGPADAAAVADAEPADAGPADAATAVAEAKPDADAGAAAAAGPGTGAANDAGAVASNTGGPGTSSGPPTGTPGLPSPAAVAAGTSLLDYLPPGDVVAVFLRFDRLRGTPWAAPAEAILAPMPDYRTLVGSRDAVIADLFDSLIISTPRPREVTATTLAGRTHLAGDAVRTFLDRPDARVIWSTTRGGAAGRRQPSPIVAARDARVFLMPFPAWIVLTQPAYLGNLLAPGEGDIDQAPAADLPPWLARLRDIEDTMGRDAGPVLAATIEGLLPPEYTAPYVGAVTTPRRLTLTVDITKGGFFVRGTMLFDSADAAGHFVSQIRKAQDELTSSRLGRMLLTPIHAYHALRGLSFQHDGPRVAYATSISVADARGMLAMAAHWARDFFEGPAPKAPKPAPPPAPAPAPAPPPKPPPAPPPAPAPAPPPPAPAP